jgi:hypothetical protein
MGGEGMSAQRKEGGAIQQGVAIWLGKKGDEKLFTEFMRKLQPQKPRQEFEFQVWWNKF